MHRLLSLALRLVLPLFLLGTAQAEGLVQLTLRGQIATPGGAPMEVHLGFWDGKEVRSVDLRLHLAESTTARDLGVLLAARLRKAGGEFQFPGEHEGGERPAQLFIEDATLVSLRLGHGMTASVTTTQVVPKSVRFQAPIEALDVAQVSICVSTWHPHLKKPGRVSLSLNPAGDADPSTMCEALFTNGLEKGLISDRPRADLWSPTKTKNGAVLTGCSIDLSSKSGDWGLEVHLETPRKM